MADPGVLNQLEYARLRDEYTGDPVAPGWRGMIDQACLILGETVVSCTLSEQEIDREFDSGYGGSEGAPFTAWTEHWVLFPVVYDGAESIGYVPRDPCQIATQHWGGE